MLKTSNKRVETNILVINEPSSVLTFKTVREGGYERVKFLKIQEKVIKSSAAEVLLRKQFRGRRKYQTKKNCVDAFNGKDFYLFPFSIFNSFFTFLNTNLRSKVEKER